MQRSLIALCALNFFMADIRDGLGPFLCVYLQQQRWSPAEIGLVMTTTKRAVMMVARSITAPRVDSRTSRANALRDLPCC